MNHNLLVGQSGGPTAVINGSLYGVVSEGLANPEIDNVIGMVNGIEGFLADHTIDMAPLKENGELERIRTTPGSYLGSCRYKLPEDLSDPVYPELFQKFTEKEISYFFYIGGNDSMDTVDKLNTYAKAVGKDVKIVGIPKTIDNDLCITDHTPGYGSAAKYVASTLLEIGHDTSIYPINSVTIVEIMGRDAGWLTGASVLARNKYNHAPHLIYLPEVAFDEAQFRSTNPRVLEHQAKRDALHERYTKAMNAGPDLNELRQIILDEEIVCPISGTKNWTEVRQFNLMFSTEMGSTAEGSMKVYLRPETAQGIFVNYLNVQKTGRMKIPFGIAQIGKAFRNEIVARQFIFRMREFEQMEMQFFVKPGTELEWFKKWKETRLKWHKALGFGDDHYRFHDHEKLAHYANAATDIEFLMPFGFKEVEGIHSRTNFDLSQHEKFSGKSIKYFDPEINESYTPYVIETSIGVDRMFLSVMSAAYCEEKLENGETRVVLKLPAALAPVKLAIMPLVKKDGLPEKAREIMNDLKFHFHCQYDEKDSIGKRYRRQDAIGTPYCITIDHQTLEDNCVTLRNRDTMEQERVAIADLNNIIADKVSITTLLKTLQ